MKFSFSTIMFFCIITSNYSTYAQKQDTASETDAITLTLEQRIADLEMRVVTLEQLLTISKSSEIQGTKNWNDRTSWRKLKTGMTMNQVEVLLGSPKRISGGNTARWYYSGESLHGIVVFYEGCVDRWEEP